jgi:hypothetical protein
MNTEPVLHVLIAWAADKTRRAGRAPKKRFAEERDDSHVAAVRHLVLNKLADDPVLATLEAEVAKTGRVTTETSERLWSALECAAAVDRDFATELEAALAALQQRKSHPGITVTGVVSGDIIFSGDTSVGSVGDRSTSAGGGYWLESSTTQQTGDGEGPTDFDG